MKDKFCENASHLYLLELKLDNEKQDELVSLLMDKIEFFRNYVDLDLTIKGHFGPQSMLFEEWPNQVGKKNMDEG